MGYFKAIVYDPAVTLVSQDQHREIVDVLVAADEGDQYRLKDLHFRGAKAFPAEELRRQFAFHLGDIVDVYKIRDGLMKVRDVYRNGGYLNFTPVPDTEFNDQQHSVLPIIELDEGPLFHVGKLTVAGQESRAGARDKLLQAWHKYQGQRYDPAVLDRFLHDVHARPGVKPEEIFEISLDSANHLVNASMTLAKPFD